MSSLDARSATFYTLLDQLSEMRDLLAKLHEEELEKLRSGIVEERLHDKRKSAKSTIVQDSADIDIELASAISVNELIPRESEGDPYESEEENSMTDYRSAEFPSRSVGLSFAVPRESEKWTSTDARRVTIHWSQRNNQFDQFHTRSPWCDVHDFDHLSVAAIMEGISSTAVGSITTAPSFSDIPANQLAMLHAASYDVSSQARAEFNNCTRRLVLHPESRARLCWVLACMTFLIYDLAMVPFDLCFEPEETAFFQAVDIISAAFWTLDMLLTFCTGVYVHDKLVMTLGVIALRYLKSWFILDLLLVLPEWLNFLLDERFPGGHITVFRFVRWSRLLRLLRVGRVLRFAKMKPALRQLAIAFHLSRAYVACFHSWISTTLSLCVIVHLLACFWYAFGNLLDNGWVQANGLTKEELSHLYMISAHWTFGRLHGLAHGIRLETSWELFVDTLLIYLSLLICSYYIGQVSALCIAGSSSSTLNLWKTWIAYARTRRISRSLQFKVMKILESSHYQCAGEAIRDEMTLLEALPLALQYDLIYEARHRFVMTMVFFSDLNAFNPRSLRHICNDAMTTSIAVETEVVFAYADACTNMRIVESGRLRYFPGGDMVSLSSDLKPFSHVSEAVLWTPWEHVGKAVCVEETVILSVDAAAFAEVILQHKGSTLHAIRYAKRFVWNLNHLQGPSDLTSFHELTIDILDEDMFLDTSENHFIFITHYKVESGTEATLIRDLMLTLLHDDMNHPANFLQSPIFIDSEDLVDLARLKNHVTGSATLVVLLTPGIFSRPWCLIEIVTAIRHSVKVVLVEIQRPGCSYRYPDEEFYAGVLLGNLLDKDGKALLAQEGISPEEVVKAIRRIFMKIALPFSPHKSKAVREAELQDILKRCNDRLRDMVRESGESVMPQTVTSSLFTSLSIPR